MEDCIRREDAIARLKKAKIERANRGAILVADEDDIILWLNKLPAADVRTEISKERLMDVLTQYFTIGDSYTYELTRVKEAFEIGTMTFEDFVEWDDEKVEDLCDYIMSNL